MARRGEAEPRLVKRKQDDCGTQARQQHRLHAGAHPSWNLVDPAPERALHEVQQQKIGTPRLLGGKVGRQSSTEKPGETS